MYFASANNSLIFQKKSRLYYSLILILSAIFARTLRKVTLKENNLEILKQKG